MGVSPKAASTVVLMRDRNNGGSQPEVLMVERNPKSLVGPGAFVFPGGVLEPQDCSPAVMPLSPHFTPKDAAALIADDSPPDQALGLFMAAIRETFEETLVLLAGPETAEEAEPHGLSEAEMLTARERLVEGNGEFLSWLETANLRPFTENLIYFGHWITPEANPHRFSTHFFLVEASQNALVIPDSREIKGYLWLHPKEALEMRENGEIHLMASTAINLDLLSQFDSTVAAMENMKSLKVDTVMPEIRFGEKGNRIVLYPWDAEYGQ